MLNRPRIAAIDALRGHPGSLDFLLMTLGLACAMAARPHLHVQSIALDGRPGSCKAKTSKSTLHGEAKVI